METLLNREAEQIASLEAAIAKLEESHGGFARQREARDQERKARISALLDEWLPLSDLCSAMPDLPSSTTPHGALSSSSSIASGSIYSSRSSNVPGGDMRNRPNAARARMHAIAAQMKDSKYSRGR